MSTGGSVCLNKTENIQTNETIGLLDFLFCSVLILLNTSCFDGTEKCKHGFCMRFNYDTRKLKMYLAMLYLYFGCFYRIIDAFMSLFTCQQQDVSLVI